MSANAENGASVVPVDLTKEKDGGVLKTILRFFKILMVFIHLKFAETEKSRTCIPQLATLCSCTMLAHSRTAAKSSTQVATATSHSISRLVRGRFGDCL